jgi:hypothetical protein
MLSQKPIAYHAHQALENEARTCCFWIAKVAIVHQEALSRLEKKLEIGFGRIPQNGKPLAGQENTFSYGFWLMKFNLINGYLIFKTIVII